MDSSEEALQYLIEREQFEDEHPAKKARQARNKEAWKQPIVGGGNGNGRQTAATGVGTVQDEIDKRFEELTRKKGKRTTGLGEEQTISTDGVRSTSEFESHLDASQREILKEIRARRESRRADPDKKL